MEANNNLSAPSDASKEEENAARCAHGRSEHRNPRSSDKSSYRPPRQYDSNDAQQQRSRTSTPAGHPSCMRPCQESLQAPPQKPEEHARMRFGGKSLGRRPAAPQNQEQKRPGSRNVRQPFNGVSHLYEVIQVRLARTQRLVEVNTNGIRLTPNTTVLVRVRRNIMLATTVGCRFRRVAEINALPFVVRIASKEDIDIDRDNALVEKKAQALAAGYAIENNLLMKVLSADLSHDHKNITINFASDVRVDFRDMVAFLAGKLKLRVEMYQLGLRNGTGLICGLGSCGQLLCCGRFLGQFDPIAVRQLRAQGLAANPKRISGVCGRLYCCMSYEYVDYMREQRQLPRKGKRVFTQWGIGRVTDIDTLREDFVVTYDNGESQRVTLHDCLPVTDAIAAKADSGEIEFPLEPAKFYLNRDPSSACEMETRTQTRQAKQVSNFRSHRFEASRARHIMPSSPNTPLHGDTPPSASPASSDTPPSRSRRRRPAAHPPANKESEERRTKPSREQRDPRSSAAPTAQTHTNPNLSEHMARMPRTVKARQANLEESANNDQKRDPNRRSRRRYMVPFNPNSGGPNPSPDGHGAKK